MCEDSGCVYVGCDCVCVLCIVSLHDCICGYVCGLYRWVDADSIIQLDCYKLFERILHPYMAQLKNITNGEIELNFDSEDRAADNYKFTRVPGGDIYQAIRSKDSSTPTNYYIENIRTGSFSQISQNYLIESKSAKSQHSGFTTNSFETEMVMLRTSIETKLSKSISFFQGIFAGMALLFTITLNLSQSVSRELVRVEDQAIRVVALLTTLGSFFSMLRARDRYFYIKLRGTSSEIDQRYKCLVLCIIELLFYTASYIVYNISHTFAVGYNISGSGYQQLSVLTTVYTALCLIGWVVTNVNSKKHQR